MKKSRLLLTIGCLMIGTGSYLNYKLAKPIEQASDLTLENMETMGWSLSDWWDSPVYDCITVQHWVLDCKRYGDIKREPGDIQIGGTTDPDDYCFGFFLEDGTDCVAGGSVAHCWDC